MRDDGVKKRNKTIVDCNISLICPHSTMSPCPALQLSPPALEIWWCRNQAQLPAAALQSSH